MKNIIVFTLILTVQGTLFLAGCHSTGDSNMRLYGGMGEFKLDDKSLQTEWYGDEAKTSDKQSVKPKKSNSLTSKEAGPIPNFFGLLFGSKEKKRGNVKDEYACLPDYNRSLFPVDCYGDNNCFPVRVDRLPLNELHEMAVLEQKNSRKSESTRLPSPSPDLLNSLSSNDELNTVIYDLQNKAGSPVHRTVKTVGELAGQLPLQVDPSMKNDMPSGKSAPKPLVIREDSQPIRQVHYIDTIKQTEAIPLEKQDLWKSQTRSAIESLERELQAKKQDGTITSAEEMKLQLLQMALREETAKKGTYTSESMEQFWQEQCKGLTVILQGSGEKVDSDRSVISSAADHFQKGLDSLSKECPLVLRKALFVKETAPFGLYEEHLAKYKAGETLHLYAELDHVISRTIEGGEEIAIHCVWTLFDEQNRPVVPRHEETCRSLSESRLRDIVLNISVETPKNIVPGKYHLDLTLNDTNDPQKPHANRQMDFEIVAP